MAWNFAKSEAIAWLLDPYSVRDFAETFYERKPLYIKRGRPDYYSNFFSIANVEQFLFGSELTPYDMTVSKNGADALPASYCRTVKRAPTPERRNAVEIIDPHRASELFGQGCTLVFEKAGRFSEPIGKLSQKLESFFGHEIFAGVFLTPPHSSGLSVHFDTVDTVVLQIEGRKHWRVYEPTITLPLEYHQRFETATHRPGDVVLDIELEPGDLLYLPRGTYHEPRANSNEHSLHVTLGLRPIRWTKVLEKAIVRAAKEHAELRRSTAAALDPAVLARILQHAFSVESLGSTLSAMESDFVTGHRNALGGQLQQALGTRDLCEDSVVSLREDALYEVVVTDRATVIKVFGGELRMPLDAAPMIRELEGGSPMRVGALNEAGKEAVPVVRRLICSGVVVRVDLPPGGSIGPSQATKLARNQSRQSAGGDAIK